MSKLTASLSLDLDNKWSYMKTHGDAGWEAFPSYLDLVIPRFLDVLDELNLKITVFVVGQDAALEKNHASLRQIHARGHEVGNHSFRHEPWLHLYSPEELKEEFERTEEALAQICPEKLIGFRGPGFSLSRQTLCTLAERGYEYDCSTFPTFLGPLARAYYFFTARLSKEERQQRKLLFGKMSEGFRPLRPYRWDTTPHPLVEIPVTTMPLIRAPIHLSYLLYLSRFSPWLAETYFAWACRMCRMFGQEPSLLLHPLDFLGGDDDPDLAFFPAMDLPGMKKVEFVKRTLKRFTDNFDVVPMREHAARVKARLKSSPRSLPEQHHPLVKIPSQHVLPPREATLPSSFASSAGRTS